MGYHVTADAVANASVLHWEDVLLGGCSFSEQGPEDTGLKYWCVLSKLLFCPCFPSLPNICSS